MRYPYEEDSGGDLRSEHLTGKKSERLLAADEIISLAKEVLTEQQYLEAEELAINLVGTKSQQRFARNRLMSIVEPPPKRPLYYTQWEITYLPNWTRDIMRDLGDYIDMLVKAAVYEKTRDTHDLELPLGGAINNLKKYRTDFKQLTEILKMYNRFIYRDAKHNFKLPRGRSEHRFTSREVVLTIFITMNLADMITSLSPMAERVRRDEDM